MTRWVMISMALALFLSTSTASAVDDIFLMEKIHRRGKIGLIGGAVGPPAFFVGLGVMGAGGALGSGTLALGGFTVAGAGAAGTLVGVPLLAASSIRGANLLGTSKQLGYATWALWGAALMSGTASDVAPEAGNAIFATGGLCYVGSLVTGGLQLRQNRHAVESSLSWQLVPTTNGLALAGQF